MFDRRSRVTESAASGALSGASSGGRAGAGPDTGCDAAVAAGPYSGYGEPVLGAAAVAGAPGQGADALPGLAGAGPGKRTAPMETPRTGRSPGPAPGAVGSTMSGPSWPTAAGTRGAEGRGSGLGTVLAAGRRRPVSTLLVGGESGPVVQMRASRAQVPTPTPADRKRFLLRIWRARPLRLSVRTTVDLLDVSSAHGRSGCAWPSDS